MVAWMAISDLPAEIQSNKLNFSMKFAFSKGNVTKGRTPLNRHDRQELTRTNVQQSWFHLNWQSNQIQLEFNHKFCEPLPGKPTDETPGKGRNRSWQVSSLKIPLAVPAKMLLQQ
jgi:hypothetical protein